MARGRPPSIYPTRDLNTHLDEMLMARLDLHLWSEVEGRVPKGGYQRFFNERLREFFSTELLDISAAIGGNPGRSMVRASPETLVALKEVL